ncbi:hypothetical protein RHSIM_Rhsim13G0206200 [Rhododendron simsii]|uniref:Uncharacterized protein n=1 Tax=Rhododendron simsii TaxID=118357 RepID=A0A834FZ54_RHOSS|nr:hypothetical protein RHSIM_Rhsim13G0206200 [Rhododendron simsii]
MSTEGLQTQRPPAHPYLMKSISSTFRSTITLTSLKFKCLCALSSPNSTITEELTLIPTRKKSVPSSTKNPRERGGVRSRVSDAQLKEKWLDSLTCPCPNDLLRSNCGVSDVGRSDSDSPWVIGVDPDVSGALALLKNDDFGCSPQVFDSPHLKLLVGKRTRRRLDTKSIVQLLKSFDAPVGTTAYVEQSTPYPQDGKQVSGINISRNCNCFSILGITTASQLSFFVDITMAVTINAGLLSFPYHTLHGLDYVPWPWATFPNCQLVSKTMLKLVISNIQISTLILIVLYHKGSLNPLRLGLGPLKASLNSSSNWKLLLIAAYFSFAMKGWWSGGFGYGLWIGILVASGFSVIPVPSTLWKNEFKLTGNGSSKDDSREAASTLFPSMSSLLRRKKDHVCDSWGCRAEALLIAAYGKGLKLSTNSSRTLEELTSTLTQETDKGVETHYGIN